MINKEQHDLLQNHIFEGSPHTIFDTYIAILLYTQKHSITREGFSDLLKLIHSLLPAECHITTSVHKLKNFLKKKMGFKEPKKLHICETCGEKTREPGGTCGKEECIGLGSNPIEFFDLGLENQLEELFKGKYNMGEI